MSQDVLILEQSGGIATITFNRPEVHNAFNEEMLDGLRSALDSIADDPAIRVIVLTGAGEKSFVSGSDIKEISKRTKATGIKSSGRRQGVLSRLEQMPMPSIAAINGYAFGIGCELAMACTLRVASDRAKLGQLEINLGIIPGAGGTQRLPRLIGKGRALELILTGRIIGAEEAAFIGLINKVAPHDKLMDEVRSLAGTLASKSPVALKYAMRAVYQGLETDLAMGLQVESLCLGDCLDSEDSKEGLAAFIEKRKPQFRGK